MHSPYKSAEIKAAMALKKLSIMGIARQMGISHRTLNYFIKGTMGMNNGNHFLELLQPELTEISKIRKRFKCIKVHDCEVG